MGERIQRSPPDNKAGDRPWRRFAIFSAITVGLLAFIARDFISAEWHAAAARAEIADLARKIPIGATRDYVAETFASGDYEHLSLRTHGRADRWFFHTPARIGASDWILMVTFGQGRVASVRVGTSDDLARRPQGAPADRGVE